MGLILTGDNREMLDIVSEQSVHCCVTSPPYFGLRDYGVAGQIGQEPTLEEYIEALLSVFRKVRKTLRRDGLLFVNLGDTYSSGNRATYRSTGGANKGVSVQDGLKRPRNPDGIKSNELCNIPHRFAEAMRADGWYWRDTILWVKPSPMPSSQNGVRWERHYVRSRGELTPCVGCSKCIDNDGWILRRGKFRCTAAHEYIFMFAKSEDYFCDAERCREPAVGNNPGNKRHKHSEAAESGTLNTDPTKMRTRLGLAKLGAVEKRLPRNVWKIAPEGYTGQHFATFPSELPKRCIEIACSAGGVCEHCGDQYAPAVKTERVPTRPGAATKVGRASDKPDSPYHQHSGPVVGNRDPKRHVTAVSVLGYRPTCECSSIAPAKPVVLDPFGGSGTTAQAAEALGCDWILCELNQSYVDEDRISATPRWAKAKRARKRRVEPNDGNSQLLLF